MKPYVSIITLAVGNLEKSVRFYRDGLGWKTRGIVGADLEYGAAAFFELQPGLSLALWPRESLAHEAGVEQQPPAMTEFMLSHCVGERGEVEQVLSTAEQAGGQIVRPAHETLLGGYSGMFKDPDGHLWEVAWSPPQPAASEPATSDPNPAP
ncbi:VOC family protein [Yanghanlia caeni]|jgi:predicted lactoylglutathione lyase|uniref:VOC family protein n=1 Tax=Yanghanlia caeni TaxID=3064283 RepID=A0ABU1D436_9BURK|nr:VOC family protein [Alcaligenaceae bacterium LG-2]NGR08354.1 VOC family protein [bacterium SGD-2]HZH57568.1 VOC family protein [Burkholderiaceae bacterium]